MNFAATVKQLGFNKATFSQKNKGRISNLSSLSKQLFKTYYDGYDRRLSRLLATAIKRYIDLKPKHERRSPEFVMEIRRKIFILHEYNLKVAATKPRYPRSEEFIEILIMYVELECEVLYSYKQISDVYEESVTKRVLQFLRIIVHDSFYKSEFDFKSTIRACDEVLLKIYASVRADCVSENKLVTNTITKLLKLSNLLDVVNKLRGVHIPYHQDTILKDPLVTEVRDSLISSDYESDFDCKSDDEVEMSVNFDDLNKTSIQKFQNGHYQDPLNFLPRSQIQFEEKFKSHSLLQKQEFNDFFPKINQNKTISTVQHPIVKSLQSEVNNKNEFFSSKHGSSKNQFINSNSLKEFATSDSYQPVVSMKQEKEPKKLLKQTESNEVSKNGDGIPVSSLETGKHAVEIVDKNSAQTQTSRAVTICDEIIDLDDLPDPEDDVIFIENNANEKLTSNDSGNLLSMDKIKLEENGEDHSPNFPVTTLDNNQNFFNSNNATTNSNSTTELNQLKNNSGNDSAKDTEAEDEPQQIDVDKNEETLEIDKENEDIALSITQEQQLLDASEEMDLTCGSINNDDLENEAQIQVDKAVSNELIDPQVVKPHETCTSNLEHIQHLQDESFQDSQNNYEGLKNQQLVTCEDLEFEAQLQVEEESVSNKLKQYERQTEETSLTSSKEDSEKVPETQAEHTTQTCQENVPNQLEDTSLTYDNTNNEDLENVAECVEEELTESLQVNLQNQQTPKTFEDAGQTRAANNNDELEKMAEFFEEKSVECRQVNLQSQQPSNTSLTDVAKNNEDPEKIDEYFEEELVESSQVNLQSQQLLKTIEDISQVYVEKNNKDSEKLTEFFGEESIESPQVNLQSQQLPKTMEDESLICVSKNNEYLEKTAECFEEKSIKNLQSQQISKTIEDTSLTKNNEDSENMTEYFEEESIESPQVNLQSQQLPKTIEDISQTYVAKNDKDSKKIAKNAEDSENIAEFFGGLIESPQVNLSSQQLPKTVKGARMTSRKSYKTNFAKKSKKSEKMAEGFEEESIESLQVNLQSQQLPKTIEDTSHTYVAKNNEDLVKTAESFKEESFSSSQVNLLSQQLSKAIEDVNQNDVAKNKEDSEETNEFFGEESNRSLQVNLQSQQILKTIEDAGNMENFENVTQVQVESVNVELIQSSQNLQKQKLPKVIEDTILTSDDNNEENLKNVPQDQLDLIESPDKNQQILEKEITEETNQTCVPEDPENIAQNQVEFIEKKSIENPEINRQSQVISEIIDTIPTLESINKEDLVNVHQAQVGPNNEEESLQNQQVSKIIEETSQAYVAKNKEYLENVTHTQVEFIESSLCESNKGGENVSQVETEFVDENLADNLSNEVKTNSSEEINLVCASKNNENLENVAQSQVETEEGIGVNKSKEDFQDNLMNQQISELYEETVTSNEDFTSRPQPQVESVEEEIIPTESIEDSQLQVESVEEKTIPKEDIHLQNQQINLDDDNKSKNSGDESTLKQTIIEGESSIETPENNKNLEDLRNEPQVESHEEIVLEQTLEQEPTLQAIDYTINPKPSDDEEQIPPLLNPELSEEIQKQNSGPQPLSIYTLPETLPDVKYVEYNDQKEDGGGHLELLADLAANRETLAVKVDNEKKNSKINTKPKKLNTKKKGSREVAKKADKPVEDSDNKRITRSSRKTLKNRDSEDEKCKPHDFISTPISKPQPTNNVYDQNRLLENNTISEDSNDSSPWVIDSDHINTDVYEEETVCDGLEFVITEYKEIKEEVCISIPEESCISTNLDILKQMEVFIDIHGPESEQAIESVDSLAHTEEKTETKCVKTTDHSIENILNKTPETKISKHEGERNDFTTKVTTEETNTVDTEVATTSFEPENICNESENHVQTQPVNLTRTKAQMKAYDYKTEPNLIQLLKNYEKAVLEDQNKLLSKNSYQSQQDVSSLDMSRSCVDYNTVDENSEAIEKSYASTDSEVPLRIDTVDENSEAIEKSNASIDSEVPLTIDTIDENLEAIEKSNASIDSEVPLRIDTIDENSEANEKSNASINAEVPLRIDTVNENLEAIEKSNASINSEVSLRIDTVGDNSKAIEKSYVSIDSEVPLRIDTIDENSEAIEKSNATIDSEVPLRIDQEIVTCEDTPEKVQDDTLEQTNEAVQNIPTVEVTLPETTPKDIKECELSTNSEINKPDVSLVSESSIEKNQDKVDIEPKIKDLIKDSPMVEELSLRSVTNLSVKHHSTKCSSITPEKKRSTKVEERGKVLEETIRKMKKNIVEAENAKKHDVENVAERSERTRSQKDKVDYDKKHTKKLDETSKKDVSHKRRRSRSSSKSRIYDRRSDESSRTSKSRSSDKRSREKHYSDSDSDHKRRGKSKSLDKDKISHSQDTKKDKKSHTRSSSKSESCEKSKHKETKEHTPDIKDKQNVDSDKKKSKTPPRSKSHDVKAKCITEKNQKVKSDKTQKGNDVKSSSKKNKDEKKPDKVTKLNEEVLFKADEKVIIIKSKKDLKAEEQVKNDKCTHSTKSQINDQSGKNNGKMNEKEITKSEDKPPSQDKSRRSHSKEKKMDNLKNDKRNVLRHKNKPDNIENMEEKKEKVESSKNTNEIPRKRKYELHEEEIHAEKQPKLDKDNMADFDFEPNDNMERPKTPTICLFETQDKLSTESSVIEEKNPEADKTDLEVSIVFDNAHSNMTTDNALDSNIENVEKPVTPVLDIPNEKPATPVLGISNEKPASPVVDISNEKPASPVLDIPNEKPGTPVPDISNEKPTTPVLDISMSYENFCKGIKENPVSNEIVENVSSFYGEEKEAEASVCVKIFNTTNIPETVIETSNPMKILLQNENLSVSSSGTVFCSTTNIHEAPPSIVSSVVKLPGLDTNVSSTITAKVVPIPCDVRSISPSCSTSFPFNDPPIGLEDISPTKILASNQLDYIAFTTTTPVEISGNEKESNGDHDYTLGDPLLGGNNEDKIVLSTGLSLSDAPDVYPLNVSHLDSEFNNLIEVNGNNFMEENEKNDNNFLEESGNNFIADNVPLDELFLPSKKKPDCDIPKPEDVQNEIEHLNMLVGISQSSQPKSSSVDNAVDRGSNNNLSVGLGTDYAVNHLLLLTSQNNTLLTTQNNTSPALSEFADIMESNVPSSTHSTSSILESTISESVPYSNATISVCGNHSTFMSDNHQKVVVEPIEQYPITSEDQLKKDYRDATMNNERAKSNTTKLDSKPVSRFAGIDWKKKDANKNEATKEDALEIFTRRKSNKSQVVTSKKKQQGAIRVKPEYDLMKPEHSKNTAESKNISSFDKMAQFNVSSNPKKSPVSNVIMPDKPHDMNKKVHETSTKSADEIWKNAPPSDLFPKRRDSYESRKRKLVDVEIDHNKKPNLNLGMEIKKSPVLNLILPEKPHNLNEISTKSEDEIWKSAPPSNIFPKRRDCYESRKQKLMDGVTEYNKKAKLELGMEIKKSPVLNLIMPEKPHNLNENKKETRKLQPDTSIEDEIKKKASFSETALSPRLSKPAVKVKQEGKVPMKKPTAEELFDQLIGKKSNEQQNGDKKVIEQDLYKNPGYFTVPVKNERSTKTLQSFTRYSSNPGYYTTSEAERRRNIVPKFETSSERLNKSPGSSKIDPSKIRKYRSGDKRERTHSSENHATEATADPFSWRAGLNNIFETRELFVYGGENKEEPTSSRK